MKPICFSSSGITDREVKGRVQFFLWTLYDTGQLSYWFLKRKSYMIENTVCMVIIVWLLTTLIYNRSIRTDCVRVDDDLYNNNELKNIDNIW